VKQEVVGINEELPTSQPLQVIERRDRSEQQCAGTNHAARMAHDDAEPIALIEAGEHGRDARGPTIQQNVE
jgi:hypothetical protein